MNMYLKKKIIIRLCCWSVACKKKKQQLFVSTAELGLKRIVFESQLYVWTLNLSAPQRCCYCSSLLFLRHSSLRPRQPAIDRTNAYTHTYAVNRLHTVGLRNRYEWRLVFRLFWILPFLLCECFFVFHLGLVISFSSVALAHSGNMQ